MTDITETFLVILFECQGDNVLLDLVFRPHSYAETHEMQFEISKTELDSTYQQTKELCEQYPVRGL